jgi:hypothetical protein
LQKDHHEKQIGCPVKETRVHERRLPSHPSKNPRRQILSRPEVAPPTTEEAPEKEGPNEGGKGQQGTGRQQTTTKEVVEEGLEVERPDGRPIEEIVRQHVPYEHDVQDDLERNSGTRNLHGDLNLAAR